MVEGWKCPECGRTQETEGDITIAFCRSCGEEMEVIETK